MRERDTVWIDLADKHRPAVVLEVRGGLVRVAYGTSRERHGPETAVVHASTRAGRKFPLTTTTFFYGDNTAWEQPEALRRGESPCARDLFDAIRRLVEAHDSTMVDEPTE